MNEWSAKITIRGCGCEVEVMSALLLDDVFSPDLQQSLQLALFRPDEIFILADIGDLSQVGSGFSLLIGVTCALNLQHHFNLDPHIHSVFDRRNDGIG